MSFDNIIDDIYKYQPVLIIELGSDILMKIKNLKDSLGHYSYTNTDKPRLFGYMVESCKPGTFNLKYVFNDGTIKIIPVENKNPVPSITFGATGETFELIPNSIKYECEQINEESKS